jgi:cysteine synthase A
MKHENILSTIGNTPVVKLNKLFKDSQAEIWLKLERANPGGSIKDRIAIAMIESAEKRGDLKVGMEVIEPTSGNTGIGLAMVCAVKGYKLKLVMPESMSIERRRYMKALGAELVLTPKEKGIPGAVERAKEILAENKNAWMPQQFSNQDNPRIHRETTALEILNDFPQGIDYLITGVGTGGHITGCAEVLKPKMSNLKVYAVEPSESPVISGGEPGPHPIQGIGGGFIPKNLNVDLLDGSIQVSGEDAIRMMERTAKEEGILLGISSGATLSAIESKISDYKKGEIVLGFCYDTGERYFSNENLFG